MWRTADNNPVARDNRTAKPLKGGTGWHKESQMNCMSMRVLGVMIGVSYLVAESPVLHLVI